MERSELLWEYEHKIYRVERFLTMEDGTKGFHLGERW